MLKIATAAFLTCAGLARAACPLPGEAPMLIVTLYFGESIPHRPPLTPAEWSHFAATTITPQFPDGFTVTDGQGQWRDGATGEIIREPSKQLTIAVNPSPGLTTKIHTVTSAYEKMFDQVSVGITTQTGCGAF